jgi:hypothetical protein
MKSLLIAEMRRAIELLEANEKPFAYSYSSGGRESAEIKRILLSIRAHSIKLEKESPKY